MKVEGKLRRSLEVKALARSITRTFVQGLKGLLEDEPLKVNFVMSVNWKKGRVTTLIRSDVTSLQPVRSYLSDKDMERLTFLQLDSISVICTEYGDHSKGGASYQWEGARKLKIDISTPYLDEKGLYGIDEDLRASLVHELVHVYQERAHRDERELERKKGKDIGPFGGTSTLTDFEYLTHPTEVEAYVRQAMDMARKLKLYKRVPDPQQLVGKMYKLLAHEVQSAGTGKLTDRERMKVVDTWFVFWLETYAQHDRRFPRQEILKLIKERSRRVGSTSPLAELTIEGGKAFGSFCRSLVYWLGMAQYGNMKELYRIWKGSKELRDWLSRHVNRPSYTLYYGRRLSQSELVDVGDTLHRKGRGPVLQWTTRLKIATWFAALDVRNPPTLPDAQGAVGAAKVTGARVLVDVDRMIAFCTKHSEAVVPLLGNSDTVELLTSGESFEGEVLTTQVPAKVIRSEMYPSRSGSLSGWDTTSTGQLIGYKVMGYDRKSGRAISGADSRINLPLKKGAVHRMRHPGIFLGSSAKYVLDYYAVHEYNVLLSYAFDPEDVTTGDLHDREPEITVSQGKLLSFAVYDEEGDPVRTAAAKYLYHTTSWGAAEDIVSSGDLDPQGVNQTFYFSSLSEIPLFKGDISGSDVCLVYYQGDLSSSFMRVRYTPGWARKYPEHRAYIAGQGWEGWLSLDHCEDEDGYLDEECEEEERENAETDSFLMKSSEREWVSKREGPVRVGPPVKILVPSPSDVPHAKKLFGDDVPVEVYNKS